MPTIRIELMTSSLIDLRLQVMRFTPKPCGRACLFLSLRSQWRVYVPMVSGMSPYQWFGQVYYAWPFQGLSTTYLGQE